MTHAIVWDGIAVSIYHSPNWLNSEFHHIELRADQKLPVTESGYRSHFIHQGEFALFESVSNVLERELRDDPTAPDLIAMSVSAKAEIGRVLVRPKRFSSGPKSIIRSAKLSTHGSPSDSEFANALGLDNVTLKEVFLTEFVINRQAILLFDR